MTARALATAFLVGGILLVNAGCATHRIVEFDAHNPAIRYADSGVYFGDYRVDPQEVPRILEDYDIPHDRVIHIRLDPDVRDLRGARALMAHIARGGYTRPVLVTERHAESVNVGKKKPQPKAASGGATKPRQSPGKIRYKKARE